MTMKKQLPWTTVWASLPVQLVWRESETTLYNTTELIQARQIMAEPLYRDTAREKKKCEEVRRKRLSRSRLRENKMLEIQETLNFKQ